MKAIAVSPAKVILFGEHFVVGGNSAISMTIDLPTTVTAEQYSQNVVEIESEDLGIGASFSHDGQLIQASGADADPTLRPIFQAAIFTLKKLNRSGRGLRMSVKSSVPIGMGLGSSAATAVSVVSAIGTLLGSELSKDDIFNAAYALEKMVHGQPSGVDQATVAYGGLICYRNGKVRATLQLSKPPLFVIGNTMKRRSTGEFVGKVTRMRDAQPDEYSKIASEAQRITDEAFESLAAGSSERLGRLMDRNQELLESVGVSSVELEKLISAARGAGALGAKLTGGGGGGCMIAAVEESTKAKVSRAIEQAGGEIVPGQFVPHGVRAFIQ